MGLSIFDEVTPFWRTFPLGDGDTPGDYSILTTDERRIRLDQCLISSSDPAPLLAFLEFSANGSTYVNIATFEIPAGAGVTPGVPPVDLLDVAATLLVNCVVPPGSSVRLNFPNAATAGSAIGVLATGGYV